ncbi:MAG TPA: protein-L-isoaspartate(D-aspartate) O-methyltransferase [Gammaproteobacteria bacterium]|nr:protein-L-isoaspartate(D-aspartate) O-methyltransferase [Gammaproteobacteria bacterium]
MNSDLSGVGMTSQRTRNRLIDRLREQGVNDSRILEVIKSTPRHLFVDEALAHRAYEDTALPIGFNQTISQPYIVARMTEVLLAEGPMSSVFEVGTGSGYQAAVLAQLVDKVYTVERISGMIERAASRFKMLGLRNISYRHSDGGMGWPERGPFDGIILTASPMHIPEDLVEQLVVGGRMVVPLGVGDAQELVLVTRTTAGVETEVLETVNFVPLVSGKA